MAKTKRAKAFLPSWATVVVPKAETPEPAPVEATESPLGRPWFRTLARWPEEWRERWGVRANALEDEGLRWREAEERAWIEISTEKEEQDGLSKVRVKGNADRTVHDRAALREGALF